MIVFQLNHSYYFRLCKFGVTLMHFLLLFPFGNVFLGINKPSESHFSQH